MEILIEVTEEDIRSGIRYDAWYCPIGIALSRILKTKIGVAKFYWDVDRGGDVRENYRLTEEAVQFVKDFDAGFDVSPFSFIQEASGFKPFVLRYKDRRNSLERLS